MLRIPHMPKESFSSLGILPDLTIASFMHGNPCPPCEPLVGMERDEADIVINREQAVCFGHNL